MNHSGFTAELQERELYNSQETGWCGTNIHQAQIPDYLPLLRLAKRNTPCAGQPVNGFSRGALLSRWKVSVFLVRGNWGVLSPLCPRDEPSAWQRMGLSSAQPHLDHRSWSQRSLAAMPSNPFYEQHLIIHPLKTFCTINLEWSRGRRLLCHSLCRAGGQGCVLGMGATAWGAHLSLGDTCRVILH